jgi:D-3-phosphoglycerate dehydrogenase
MPRLLITDRVSGRLVEEARRLGYTVDYIPGISREELMESIGGYEYLVVRGRLRLDRELLSRAGRLRAIIRYGVGLDNIDLEYCRERGIAVFNTPKAFTEAVAELTLGLIIGVMRGVGEAHRGVKAGLWPKGGLVGRELRGKTVGIIGFGRIGRRVAELLDPFEVEILVYDVRRIEGLETLLRRSRIRQVESLYEIAEKADIITIHVPLTRETEGMIDEEFLGRCRDGAYIVNTSRGEVIDEEALIRHLGRLGGVALDVFRNEPEVDKRLLEAENALYTPHIGGQTAEAWERAVDEVVEILKRLRG